jgi:hypothetical protein
MKHCVFFLQNAGALMQPFTARTKSEKDVPNENNQSNGEKSENSL